MTDTEKTNESPKGPSGSEAMLGRDMAVAAEISARMLWRLPAENDAEKIKRHLVQHRLDIVMHRMRDKIEDLINEELSKEMSPN